MENMDWEAAELEYLGAATDAYNEGLRSNITFQELYSLNMYTSAALRVANRLSPYHDTVTGRRIK